MTEEEMLNSLQTVWENMSWSKSRDKYAEMLVLLENMQYFLRYDLQIKPKYEPIVVKHGTFEF